MLGDQDDMQARLQRLIPNGWFAVGLVPIRDALLTGAANALAFIYSMLAYIRLQTRIATATDSFLDLIAFDFFGNTFSRSAGQSDSSFRNQLISFLFRQRNTREAINLVIQQLLGVTPVIIEPQRATDTGAWGVGSSLGYGVAGVYGSISMPLQIFVQITIPDGLLIAPPKVAGYGVPVGAYGMGLIEYIGKPFIDPIQSKDVYAALESVRPVTGVIWTSLAATLPPLIPVTVDSVLVTSDDPKTIDTVL